MSSDRRGRSVVAWLLVSVCASSAITACGGAVAAEGDAPSAVPDGDAGPSSGPSSPPPARDAGAIDAKPAEDDWGKVPDRPTSLVVTIDLGDVSADTEVTFGVPPDTLGFNVGLRTTTTLGSLAVLDVKSPSGAFVLKESVLFNGDHATTETTSGNAAAAGVPGSNHTDAMPVVTAGTWSAKFSAAGHGLVQLQTTPDGVFHGGYVDMHVYLPQGLSVDGDDVTATSYTKIAGVRDRLDELGKAMHALYGLDRGNVTFHLIGPEFVSVEDDRVNELFAQSKIGGDGQVLHVFFVEPTPSQEWWGIAGGEPSLANVTGTSEAGIALALMEDASLEGPVLAHEMGHFFGLTHPSELAGGGFDALEDTPRCTGINMSNYDRCPDVDNVMFAVGSSDGVVKSSALQRRIMQGSPVYRAFLTGTPPATGAVKGADTGKLFGHPGQPLTGAEAVVLAGMCGNPAHHARSRALARDVPRSDLLRIAEAPGARSVVRNAARGLALRARR